MAEEHHKGFFLSWNFMMVIGTIVAATIGIVTWFNGQFTSFESRLDTKYATIELVEAHRVQAMMLVISGMQNNLETVLKIMIEQDLDMETIEGIRTRIRELRDHRERQINSFVERHESRARER